MTYREPSKPKAPEPRISAGPATVIGVVITLVVLCLTVTWLSAAHG